MKITPIQLAKRVEAWQKRLAPLGVAHWYIIQVSCVDETPSGPHANATVQTDGSYDRLKMWFQWEFLEHCTEDELDHTIVHEWLHVAMRDFDHSIETIDDALSPGVCQQWHDAVDHEREGLVDRLSVAMVQLYSGQKPRFSP